jgi:uncharacterized protein (TIGR03435 family)
VVFRFRKTTQFRSHGLRFQNVISAVGMQSSKLRAILLLAIAAVPAWAQTRFEVSSVKPSRPGAAAQDPRFNMRGNRFEAIAATVGDILDMLNGFRLYRVVGGPAWMRTDRFDIVAKADQQIAEADFKSAVMALLAERFQLRSHEETRDTPGFAIRAPKAPEVLKPAAGDEKVSLRMRDGDVAFTAASMGSLTNYLSQVWGAPVEDQTKLEGAYDFTLATSRAERHTGDRWGDWVREAVEDVGFRVEGRKIPMEVTAVDRCERPSEN